MNQNYFCQKCGGIRKHILLFEKKKSGEEEYGTFQWIEKYQVIECAGCENVSFLKVYGDNHMIQSGSHGEPEYYYDEDIYPNHLKNGEELKYIHLVPENIRSIYRETVNAFKVESLLLTAAGFRAIIEAICNYLKIRKDNLEERINQLHSKGHLTQSESRRLHSIRFLGNSALHEIQKPKAEQIEILLSIVNHLLSNLFITDKMMKNKLELPLDNYEEFTRVIQILVKKEMLGKEVSLDSILGKSKKLISSKNYKIFRETLLNEIQIGKFNFLNIVDPNRGILKIVSEPELNFSWELGL